MRGKRIIGLMVGTSMAAAMTVAGATWLQASAVPNVVRLHLGTDAQQFSLGTTVQPLTVGKSSCAINSLEPLIDLSSSGNQSAPGLANYGLGVKGSPSSGNGSPCAQVEPTEKLTLKPGTGLTSRTFKSLRFDLEMTGNAVVVLTVSRGTTTETYKLLTGTSITATESGESGYDTTAPYFVASAPDDATDACAAPNSSGPNNGGNDNCQWTVTPGFNFDTVSLTTQVGTVTLEGAGDFANDPNFDSLLYLSNAPPSAVNDPVSTNEDTPTTFNVLTNDSDGDGDALSASALSGPSHGTVVPAVANGSFTYTPAANYNGSDSFTYTVTDGTDSSTATVNITVVPVNDPPVSVSSSPSTSEDTATTITVATDIDSTRLTSACTSDGGGTIVDNSDGSVTFTPPQNFNGTITLSCTTRDDQRASTQTSATIVVGVTPVNDAPVATADSAEVNQNSSVAIDVLANDTDVDLNSLVVATVTQPQHGTATPLGGKITYAPAVGFTGTDSFTYTAGDGTTTSNSATVTVTVFPVLCSTGTVTDTDGAVTGTFVRLSDSFECKRYALDANAAAGTVLFSPEGAAQVDYRGYLSFGPAGAPGGVLNLALEYDPNGGFVFQPVLLCIAPQFDASGTVTSATLPSGQTWCVASESTVADINGNALTTWQVFGHDDPRFQ